MFDRIKQSILSNIEAYLVQRYYIRLILTGIYYTLLWRTNLYTWVLLTIKCNYCEYIYRKSVLIKHSDKPSITGHAIR